MLSTIFKLEEGKGICRVASYSLSPKKALVCFIKQYLEGDFDTSRYPEDIPGMRESDTVPDHWYYDLFRGKNGDVNAVLAAYPERFVPHAFAE